VLGVQRARVERLLRLVGLPEAAVRRRVRGYSLGMRQRLGFAHALLGDPSVLILDEPANGLDPEGTRWMRTLLREFADGGGTVLLSSHLLNEVEAVADRLVVIAGGRVAAQGATADLLAHSGTRVQAEDPAALERALADAGIGTGRTADGTHLAHAAPEAVGRTAAAHGVVLHELRPAAGLEELYIALTAPAGARGPAEGGDRRVAGSADREAA